MSEPTFSKQDPQVGADFYPTEAAGLRWLGEAGAAGGVAVAEVLSVDATSITLPRYPSVPPTVEQARAFGRALAHTHAAGAPHHGAPPAGIAADADGFIATLPLPHLRRPTTHWGDFYARCRLEPFARAAHGSGNLTDDEFSDVLRLCERLRAGAEELTGPQVPAARLHGDLWNGNVLWTPQGARLIDPAAHGGHPLTDLAMLILFGLPHLEVVLESYERAAALPTGWRDQVALHQVHPLLVHAALFGGSYGGQAARTARQLLTR